MQAMGVAIRDSGSYWINVDPPHSGATADSFPHSSRAVYIHLGFTPQGTEVRSYLHRPTGYVSPRMT